MSAGEYFVTVHDQVGDSVIKSIIITEPDEIIVNLTGTNISIPGGSDGFIQLSGSGGMSPYSFTWSNGASTSSISGLLAGTYSVTIVDANGCVISDSITLTEETLQLNLSFDIIPVECYGYSNGEILAIVSGGIAPYNYSWSISNNQSEIIGLSGGEYYLTVFDANNDSVVSSAIVVEPDELDLSYFVQDVTCYGGNNGEIEVGVSGGTLPYSYLWSNGSTDQVNINLSAGTFMVYVSDINNCFSISGSEVIQPDPFTVSSVIVNASGPIANDGSAIISVTGNTAPYSYLWSNGTTSSEATGLQSDLYYVLIMDANLCDYWYFLEVEEEIYGCMDPSAANYNQDATIDNSSCIYNYPDWSYSNTGESHTILISDTATVLINNIPISSGDFIGVFYDSIGTQVCAGYVHWQGVSTAITAWGAQVGQNDGFQSGEELQWKIFDASENVIYDAQSEYYQSFLDSGLYVTNGLSGLASLIVVSYDYQIIDLPIDYSFISTYIIPFSPDIADVLADVVANVIIVKNDLGQAYWPVYSVNLIGDIISGRGYQIKMNASSSIIVEGTAVIPELSPIPIPQDFSILGYLRSTSAPIADMLSPIVSNIVIVKNSNAAVYWPLWGVDDIGNMIPGEGYQIKMSNADTLIYPANSTTFPNSYKSYLDNIQVRNTGSNMTIGIPLQSWILTPDFGDQILIKNLKGDLMGRSVFNGENMAISVWGDDYLTPDIDGMTSDEIFNLFVLNRNGALQELIVNDWQIGDDKYKTNSISVVGEINLLVTEGGFTLFQNTPNPFISTTNISYNLIRSSNVNLFVFNILGEKVWDSGVVYSKAGINTISFNSIGLQAGMYLYKIESEGVSETKIMNIVK